MNKSNVKIVPAISSIDSSLEDKASRKIKTKGFFDQFLQHSKARIQRLKKTMLGDYYYQPKNTFKQAYKQKVLNYLKAKYLTLVSEMDEAKPKKFTNYDINYGKNIDFRDLRHMKEVLLKLKTTVDAAEDSMTKSNIGYKQVKANFLNQTAFEFDRQKKSSICWGLLIGSFICSTIYKRGSQVRKIAIFLTFGHVFGQIAYHWNLDKYFDTVYKVFEQDALNLAQEDEKARIIQQMKGEKVHIIQD